MAFHIELLQNLKLLVISSSEMVTVHANGLCLEGMQIAGKFAIKNQQHDGSKFVSKVQILADFRFKIMAPPEETDLLGKDLTYCCAACTNHIVELKVLKTISLPSNYWFEMIECFSCHNEDYTKLPGQSDGIIAGKEGVLMDGRSFILTSLKDIVDGSIRLNVTGNESQFKSTRWVEIVCANCQSLIGEGFADPLKDDLDLENMISIRIHKYCAHEVNQQPKSFTECFLKDTVDLVKHHANYRFIVHNNKQPVLMLWIINWNSLITTKQNEAELLFESAIKILYAPVNNDTEPTFVKWSNDAQVDQLFYDNQYVDILIQDLQTSSESIAPSMRKMDIFNIALVPCWLEL